jgi:hypothetical protein
MTTATQTPPAADRTTMKVKRAVVYREFADIFDSLYA